MKGETFSSVLLNLDRDTDRLSHMQKQLENSGIVFTRQPGILADAVPPDLRSFFYEADGAPKTTMKKGEIGCYASHLLALKRIAAGELGSAVLVMEDDLDIRKDAKNIIVRALRKLPPGWDVLRLSCVPRRAYIRLARLSGADFLVQYSKIPNSAGAYLVTPAGAQKFLERGVRGLTFDDDLRRPWFHEMASYGIAPAPMRAGVLKSTIDSIEAGRFDKGISSRLERILRGDHLHAFRRLRYNLTTLGIGSWLFCSAVNIADMVLKPILGRSVINQAAALYWGTKKDDD